MSPSLLPQHRRLFGNGIYFRRHRQWRLGPVHGILVIWRRRDSQRLGQYHPHVHNGRDLYLAFTVTDSAGYTASTSRTVTATTATEMVLYNFTNELWANSLIAGTDGNFYGTTPTSSSTTIATAYGSIFKITPTGTLTTLYNLNALSATDGCTPEGLTEGVDGNFYGTTYTCGTNGGGNVFVISPSGNETVLHGFGSGSDGDNPKSGLIQASNGTFYGTTANGGTHGLGTVFRSLPPALNLFFTHLGLAAQTGKPLCGWHWAPTEISMAPQTTGVPTAMARSSGLRQPGQKPFYIPLVHQQQMAMSRPPSCKPSMVISTVRHLAAAPMGMAPRSN